MKKSIFLAMLSAIVLTGTMTFTACSSEDAVEPNPTYDGKSVKTSFTISVGNVKSPTRMAADDVQQDEAFNGMTDIYLFPFTSAITKDVTITESYIRLPDFSTFTPNVANANGKVYSDVSLSIGVNNFLFYAATAKNYKGNGELKASYLAMNGESDGTVVANWATASKEWDPTPINLNESKPSNITFDLVPIRRGWTLEGTTDAVKTYAGAESTIEPLNEVDKLLTTAISGLASETDQVKVLARTTLQDIQKTLRNDISTSGDANYKPYAGSSASIKSLMAMLYSALKNMAATVLSSGTGTSYGDDIIDKLEDYFTATGGTDGNWTLAWKDDPNFPGSLGVPDGAVAVLFNATAFEYVEPAADKDVVNLPNTDGLQLPSIAKYTYPARLYYTINSPAMVKDREYLTTTTFEQKRWFDIYNGQYAQGAVAASTRSVILQKQVQYAVGRLDVAVQVKPSTTIYDSGSRDITDASNNIIPQPVSVPSTGYQLTGVLIGGQKQVGWDFTPIDGATEMTIWDNKILGKDNSEIYAKQGALSAYNYTLALETKADTPVNIALEFTNNGDDFHGIDNNIIPAGTKFYLVAKLDPGENGNHDSQKEQIPEMNGDEEWPETNDVINQVFKQDYITTANLTIGANSLKSAYNVVPDLRSPKLEFGLSVDLHWRKGLTFTQEF